jgi:hypothetical protein
MLEFAFGEQSRLIMMEANSDFPVSQGSEMEVVVGRR